MNTTTLKNDHLLEESLDRLHHQTTEWISDVEFWREELAFFYRLLRRKELQGNFPTHQIADLEKQLVQLSGEDLRELEASLRRHEQRLRQLTQQLSASNELDYRHDHKTILFVVQHFESRVRSFKRAVFTFAKKS